MAAACNSRFEAISVLLTRRANPPADHVSPGGLQLELRHERTTLDRVVGPVVTVGGVLALIRGPCDVTPFLLVKNH